MPRLIGAAQAPIQETQAEQITTFTASGTLTTAARTVSIDYLVVAGGGSGGAQNAGGGGAGGFRTATGLSVSASTAYPITVGAGGAAATLEAQGNNGSNSVFSSITSTGGGGGGSDGATSGIAGGSGGGANQPRWNSRSR
jgi:hypothetical protein